MKFKVGPLGEAFWHHFGHLAVRHVDEATQVSVRILDLNSCVACRRLWDTLTPLTVKGRETFPTTMAERYRPLQRQVYVRADVKPAPRPAERPPVVEADSVRLVRRFTERDVVRPLERY